MTLVDPLTLLDRFESQVLELLLSRDVFLSQLNESEKRKTVEITLDHDDQRYVAWWTSDFINFFKDSRPSAWILIGKTMFAAEYGPFMEAYNENNALMYFIEGWRRYPDDPNSTTRYRYWESVYENIPQLIIDYAKNYIND